MRERVRKTGDSPTFPDAAGSEVKFDEHGDGLARYEILNFRKSDHNGTNGYHYRASPWYIGRHTRAKTGNAWTIERSTQALSVGVAGNGFEEGSDALASVVGNKVIKLIDLVNILFEGLKWKSMGLLWDCCDIGWPYGFTAAACLIVRNGTLVDRSLTLRDVRVVKQRMNAEMEKIGLCRRVEESSMNNAESVKYK
ncbi:Metabotropic glutamate receptor [Habropoda laboriosa]|uniref:Metabotropic glutamate receptor n=1 Tax=Habropoda laboriosa TaxID=597456 RepID=A0A0L7QJ54_9HYME|nr:Metabotropic glutamate receptor [Habropoda laboriosa]